MDESSADVDFCNLPLTFHRRLLEFITRMDPETRFQYARTCQRLWKLTEAGGNRWADYEVNFTHWFPGNEVVEIDYWPDDGFSYHLSIKNRRTQSMLLSGITVRQINVDASNNAKDMPIRMRMRAYRLKIFSFFEEAWMMALLEDMKPQLRKYTSIRFRDKIPTIKVLHYINENVASVRFPEFPERGLWSELKCSQIMIESTPSDQVLFFGGSSELLHLVHLVQSYIDEIVGEWKQGKREIRRIVLSVDCISASRVEEHQRKMDGQRIQVRYSEQGPILLTGLRLER